jgi:hypothetical protein
MQPQCHRVTSAGLRQAQCKPSGHRLHCFAVRPAQTRRVPRHQLIFYDNVWQDPALVLCGACDLLRRVAAVTLPLPGLLLRMPVYNADCCPLPHPAVVLVRAQPDLVLED